MLTPPWIPLLTKFGQKPCRIDWVFRHFERGHKKRVKTHGFGTCRWHVAVICV